MMKIFLMQAASEGEALMSPEVVHKNGVPTNIQGILKRTLSESSADDLHSGGDGYKASDGSANTLCSTSTSTSPTDLPSPREVGTSSVCQRLHF